MHRLLSFLAFSLIAPMAISGATDEVLGAESPKRLYLGDKVTTKDGLAPYTGKDAWKMLVGEKRQKVYNVNDKCMEVNYDESVDFQLRRQQVILCPQTAEYLYTQFTPTKVRYQKGSRPQLEKTVAEVTEGCHSDREKALALMRFCRDLYKKREGIEFSKYIYGGTEEQLIEKGEELCECLGRLLVALCEVAGIPGRIVMHDIGGHIVSEIYIEGKWAYIDPRAGIYCLKPDGSFASTWELWQNPALLRQQSPEVKADASARWNWEERIWKCENKFFHPLEINGLQNYSLADAKQYDYTQKPYKKAEKDGLFVLSKEYEKLTNEIFGLEEDGFRHAWQARKLRTIELAYRHDGTSMYFYPEPPMTRRQLEEDYVDPFRDGHTSMLVWGLGPGSVLCYNTKAGEMYGTSLTDKQWKTVNRGDRRVYDNLMALIREGGCPLRMALKRAHQHGLKLIARLEMNHAFWWNPPDNYAYTLFNGDFNKKHPEYRVTNHVHLDFKHQAVRDYRMGVLREAVEMGADGVSMDFVVYPPHFAKPDKAIMTQFVRDVRSMLDEVGKKQNRRLELMVRVPCSGSLAIGVDWKTWMREKLIDYIVPSNTAFFDNDIGDFVSMANRTGVRVFPTLWQEIAAPVDTDEAPGEEEKGLIRYTKPKTPEMFFAQAMLAHRAGADGLQFGFACDEWKMPKNASREERAKRKPNVRFWLDDLADPAKVEFADKLYTANPCSVVQFSPPHDNLNAPMEFAIDLRIGDDIPKAKKMGLNVKAELILYGTPMMKSESLVLYVNGHGPLVAESPADKSENGNASGKSKTDLAKPSVFQKDWWRRGERHMSIQPEWLQMGTNTIRMTYKSGSKTVTRSLTVRWLDLTLHYEYSDSEKNAR